MPHCHFEPRQLTAESQSRVEFLLGVRNVAPILIGVIPSGVLFGVVTLTAKLSFWVAVAISFFVFAGASQFAAIGLITQGAAYPLIVLTVFIINLRHAFYGASVADYLRGLPKTWRRVLAYTMTDESYAVTIAHYRDTAQGNIALKHWYFLGANLGLFICWQISTVLGYFIGQLIGDPLALGLDFTLPLIFIGILVPRLKSRAAIYSAFVAGLIAVLGFALPSKLGLLFAIAIGIVVGFGVEKWITQN